MATEGDAMRKYSALLYEQMNTRDDVSVRDAQWLLRQTGVSRGSRQTRLYLWYLTEAGRAIVTDDGRPRLYRKVT
jgi:hypothetical protein